MSIAGCRRVLQSVILFSIRKGEEMNHRFKKSVVLFLVLSCILNLTACGTVQKTTDQKSTATPAANNEASEAPSVTAKPYKAKITSKKGYRDDNHSIRILGLKEYKKLKGKHYTDKAEKGKCYLVLFLEVSNFKNVKDYFNVDNITATLDGKTITNTYLLNDPEGYQTIFDNIESQKTIAGFIAWKVPKNWKKLSLQYNGWKGSDNLDVATALTPKDLKNPEKYNSQYYDTEE